MTIPLNKIPDKVKQDAFRWACMRGRYLGGHDLIDYSRPPRRAQCEQPVYHGEDCLHLNGGGLKELKQKAMEVAIRKANGSMKDAAKILKIGRSTLHLMKKTSLIVVTALLVLSSFAGDVWLTWDASPTAGVTNYVLYGTTNATLTSSNMASAQLKVNVGTNLLVHLENISSPKLWRFGATAVADGAQSDLSNILPVEFPAAPPNARTAAIAFGIDLSSMTNHAFFKILFPVTP